MVQTSKLAKASASASKATKTTVKANASASNGVLDAATVKLGKQIWGAWRNGKLFVALGIREKTATGTGTRAAMLAVAAFGYVQGNGRVLAMAVRQAMGLNPNVGGIDFPWLEKPGNMATITSSAAIRPDAKDGKMRLLPITTSKATRSVKAKATLAKGKAKPDADRTNGKVTVIKPSKAKVLADYKGKAKVETSADIAEAQAAIDAQ